MSISLELDKDTSNFVFVNGRPQLISDTDNTAQKLRLKLRFWFKEWFTDITDGTKYRELVLIKNPNLSRIQRHLQDRILTTEGIVDIAKGTYKQEIVKVIEGKTTFNKLKVEFTAIAGDGTLIVISEVLP